MADMPLLIFAAIIAAFVVGYLCGRPAKRIVLITEGEAIGRLRAFVEDQIESKRQRLLNNNCGWSEGDRLRSSMSMYRYVLAQFPDQSA